MDACALEEEDVAHEVGDQSGIFHHRASDLDEKSLPAKALQVGQGLDEDRGFGLWVSHGIEQSKAGEGVEPLLLVFRKRRPLPDQGKVMLFPRDSREFS